MSFPPVRSSGALAAHMQIFVRDLTGKNFQLHVNANESVEDVKALLQDKEDLMHKASGWMLREVGKRVGLEHLRGFLESHANKMPRTMLRYAIERLQPGERKRWMAR